MKPPRIALVTPLWPLPGAPHAGKPIYETALRLLHWADVEVFCPAPRYPPLRWLQPARHVYHRASAEHAPPGLRTHYLEYWTIPVIGRPWNGLGTLGVLQPALRAWRPDLILSYWLYPTAWAVVKIAAHLGVPAVVGSRGSDLHRIPDTLVRRLTSSTLRRADAVLTVTEDLRTRAIAMGADAALTRSVPNGCDTSVYHPMPVGAARQALGLPEAGELVVQVGHLISSKGVFDLLAAFILVAAERPQLRLALVGDGPAMNDLRARAAAAGLSDRLLLPGSRTPSDVALWINAADVVCLASHGEGCPNVVLEAFSCGRPVVGCDVGGISELLRPGCGVLVPPHQPPALAAGLRQALSQSWDPGVIASQFSRRWEDVARETFDVCHALLRADRESPVR